MVVNLSLYVTNFMPLGILWIQWISSIGFYVGLVKLLKVSLQPFGPLDPSQTLRIFWLVRKAMSFLSKICHQKVFHPLLLFQPNRPHRPSGGPLTAGLASPTEVFLVNPPNSSRGVQTGLVEAIFLSNMVVGLGQIDLSLEDPHVVSFLSPLGLLFFQVPGPPVCQLCGKTGHLASQCWHLASFAASVSPSDEQMAQAFHAQCHLNPSVPDWTSDTGATTHMLPNTTPLQNSSPVSGSSNEANSSTGMP
ncbi:putative transcription factor interactor and regulator CCHC(Zn) family [Helianthus debilis subsp. tardiflorus]